MARNRSPTEMANQGGSVAIAISELHWSPGPDCAPHNHLVFLKIRYGGVGGTACDQEGQDEGKNTHGFLRC